MSTSTVQQQALAPPHLRPVANFLRSSKAGIKIRVGIVAGKRADYFKAKSAINALLSPAYEKLKSAPAVRSEDDARALLTSISGYAFFLRVERGAPTGPKASSPKALQVLPSQGAPVKPDEYFVWLYEGSQWTTYLGGAAMVAVMLAGVMFPLWPPIMRLGVWYLSIAVLGLIGLFFALAIVRLIFYIITVIVVSPGIWVFPKLFADVGFIESFIPLWEWDLPKKKGKKKRAGDAPAEKVSGKKSKKGGLAVGETGPAISGATIEEVVDSGRDTSPGPTRRTPTVEDASDDE